MQGLYVTLDHKTSHKYICSNSQKYIAWVKLSFFILCQKSLGFYANIMFHEDILYISFCKNINT